jgi:toxin ParE1/3/4
MSLPVILRPEADDDVETAHRELEKCRVGLGMKFVDQVRVVLERIEAMPEMYAPVWQDVRAARIRKFRHIVYYVVFLDRVEVIAVMHGSREASAWQARV